jgi:DNA-binding winged helix-turn-helix (wHTH) protein
MTVPVARIVHALATDPGRVITKQELLKRGWPSAQFTPTRILDSALTDLNHQLCAQGARRLFENVWGVGWRLAADVAVNVGERQ